MIGSTRVSRRFAAHLVLSAALGLVGATRAARADILAYDSFTGPAGQGLAGTNDGTGFSDAWHAGTLGPDNSSSYVLQQNSLTGGMASSGGRVASLASYSLGSGITRDLSTPVGTPNTTVYFSFLVRPDGTLNEGASGGFFGLALNAATTTPMLSQDLFIGKGSGSSYGIENVGGNGSQSSTTQAAIGVTTQLVVEADFAASGGEDKFTLYVNPTSGNMVPAAIKQDSFLGMINSISIYSTGASSIDELRISSSLGDIVPAGDITSAPEPASVVMLTLGGLAVVAGRRFRRTRSPIKVVAELV